MTVPEGIPAEQRRKSQEHHTPPGEEWGIVTRHLVKKFGVRTAVQDLNLRIGRGEIFGFLGPNGSGKSTTIKMLCGLLEPTAGTGFVSGIDITQDPERIRAHIGYMPQKFSLYEDLTVHENMAFYAKLYGVTGKRWKARCDAVTELVGIERYQKYLARQLSGGWKQRLSLCCALLHEPDILFLDEPTASMDPVARRQLWDLLFSLASSGVTLFVTTHYMDEAERCSSVGYIYNSRLIVSGGPDELKHLREVVGTGVQRVEVVCRPLVQTFNHIKALPYVDDVTIFGQALHVVMDEAIPLETLSADVTQAGSNITALRLIEPSLEDVFVTLTQQNLKLEAEEEMLTGSFPLPSP